MAFFRGDDSMCRTGTASDPIDYPGLAPFNFNNAFVFVGYTCDNVRSVTGECSGVPSHERAMIRRR